MRIRRFLALSFALIGGLSCLGGCKDDPTDARLRAIHAAIDAPAVDVYLAGDTTPLATGVAYGDAGTYRRVPEGTYQIELRTAGDTPGAAPLYTSPEFVLRADQQYSAVALGTYGGGAGTVAPFQVALYGESFGGSGSEHAGGRVINASPDAPILATDIDDDGVVDVPGLAFGEASGVNGFMIPADVPVQVGLRLTAPDERLTAFTTPELSSSRIYTIIATGYGALLPREEQSLQLLFVDNQAGTFVLRQNPTLFVLHASPDAPAVDVSTGGTLLVEDLGFGALSGAVQLAPGSYALDFRPTGDTSDPAASVTTPLLEAGERYLAVAAGYLLTATPDFTLLQFGDAFATGQSGALVRVVHAVPDAPAVDVGTTDGVTFTPVPDFVGIAYGEASPEAGTALAAGTLTLGVSETGLDAPVATWDVTLAGGDRVFAVAGGSLIGPGELLRLFLVDTVSFPWVLTEVPANPIPQ